MTQPDDPLLAIFDHDGVLVDSLEFHQEAWLELGRRENLPITSEFIRETFGLTNPDIFERLLGVPLEPAELARLADLKEACYRDVARPRLGLMTGVRELLDALAEAGVRLGIGTSGPRANVALTLEVCGLQDRFHGIATIEDVRQGKPDPAVFLVAARKAGVEPSRAVVFEDAPVGIQAAKAAGMRAIGVGTTHPLEVLRDAGADEVVPDLSGYAVSNLVRHLAASAF